MAHLIFKLAEMSSSPLRWGLGARLNTKPCTVLMDGVDMGTKLSHGVEKMLNPVPYSLALFPGFPAPEREH